MTNLSNIEAAADAYAKRKEAAYIQKRGGHVPANVALGIYIWAFNRFVAIQNFPLNHTRGLMTPQATNQRRY